MCISRKFGHFWTKKKFGVEKNREEIFANLIQTLTSEAKVDNPNACGVQVRSPGGGMGGQAPH